RRAAIRRWLQQRGERWREDSSNRDRRLTRNRIRHEVLPLLEQFNPRLVETLAHTAAIARAEEAFWESYIQPLCASWVRWENEQAMIAIERLREAPPAVACRVLRWAVAQVRQAGRPEPLRPPPSTDFQHIEGLLRWSLHGQSGQSFSLPRQVEARKEFEHLIIVARKPERGGPGTGLCPESYCYPVKVPGSVTVPGLGVSFRFDFVTLGEGQPRYNEQGRILLDAKLADSPLTLRNWQAGDAYQPEGHRSPKKLQDLFQRLRIPVRQRAKWPVLWAAENIVWVRGLAVAAGSSPAPGSSRAIEIREVA
ncbi:MAG TPA: tRNA lysidine(34) synthetase TilS, partial [Terriglobia bacterium]|nr:tRNA lysidine(34) synthetase TilS [Terriglobia bacterium]